jgi:glycosyltransferase involved in cell wall biosynthesis
MKKHLSSELTSDEIELIIGNSNSNFSGVTSTMLQVMSYQKELINLRIMGTHFLPDQSLTISFWQTAKMCRRPLKNGKWCIFHARRVDEMIQGILLKYLLRAKIKLVFSSAAQRKRSASPVWLTRKMDAVIAVSKRSAGFLCCPPDLINPHGVQVNDYLPAKDKQRAWADLGYGGKYGIGILGRVRKQKGVHLFVEACVELFDKYSDDHCVVVGAISSNNKELVEQLKNKAELANMTDRITFTGELPFVQLPKIFSALSLMAALSDNEGFGLTVLDAMSSAAAVLATEAGAWEEIVRPEIDGYIVPVNNQQAVIEKMDLLLSKPEKLTQMGIEGRKQVEASYRVEDEATRLIGFFRSLQ